MQKSKTKTARKSVLSLFGGPEGIRTLDLSDANRTLSQLSYGPGCLPIITPMYFFVNTIYLIDKNMPVQSGVCSYSVS